MCMMKKMSRRRGIWGDGVTGGSSAQNHARVDKVISGTDERNIAYLPRTKRMDTFCGSRVPFGGFSSGGCVELTEETRNSKNAK